MAKFEKGIPAEFSGKVGTVVGGSRRGIPYMRSKSKNKARSFSSGQLDNDFRV